MDLKLVNWGVIFRCQPYQSLVMSGNVSDQNCSYDDTIPGASSLDALHTPDFLVSFYINKKKQKKTYTTR